MARQDLTQGDVAQRAGITQPTLSRGLSGKRDVGLAEAIRICDALGVRLSDLIDRAARASAA